MKKVVISILIFWAAIAPPVHGQQQVNDKTVNLWTDSITGNDRSFRYMANIDSLLRAIQAERDSLDKLKPAPVIIKEKKQSLLAKFFAGKTVRMFFWFVLIVFIVFVLYKLFLNSFRNQAEASETASEMTDDFDKLRLPDWYNQKAGEAERDGQYADAVRYRFMSTLALLDERKIIEFLPEKTNDTYAREIRNREQRDVFKKQSLVYDYVWYGKKEIGQQQYTQLKAIFDQTNRLLN